MKAKKSLGQNFLNSKAILDIIVTTADIQETDTILEIGPGKGSLTEKLLEKANVVAVEKDHRLIYLLKEKFRKYIENGKLTLIYGDILEINLEKDLKNPYKIVANIPYYITGQIIQKFLETAKQPSKIVLMTQKEVAERIVDGQESILSLSVKAYGQPKYIKTVKAENFTPKPKVDSAILLIDDISKEFFKPLRTPSSKLEHITEKDFFQLVKAGFSHKRKMLINNLKTDWILGADMTKENLEKLLQKSNISPQTRAQNLSIENWKNILLHLKK